MKIVQKLSGATLLFVALAFTACEKDKTEKDLEDPIPVTEQETNPCRITKVNNEGFITAYSYDKNNRIISESHHGSHPKEAYFINYIYNSQGKVAEALLYNADSLPESKKTYTYDNNNNLTGIYFYENMGGVLTRKSNFILFEHDQTGKRIRADFYSATQANSLERSNEYTYSQQKITIKTFNATTNPATLDENGTNLYDTKKSPYHSLGYLNEYNPYLGKYNLSHQEWISLNGNVSYYSSKYEYNQYGYPVKESYNYYPGLAGIFTTTYEYDCQ